MIQTRNNAQVTADSVATSPTEASASAPLQQQQQQQQRPDLTAAIRTLHLAGVRALAARRASLSIPPNGGGCDASIIFPPTATTALDDAHTDMDVDDMDVGDDRDISDDEEEKNDVNWFGGPAAPLSPRDSALGSPWASTANAADLRAAAIRSDASSGDDKDESRSGDDDPCEASSSTAASAASHRQQRHHRPSLPNDFSDLLLTAAAAADLTGLASGTAGFDLGGGDVAPLDRTPPAAADMDMDTDTDAPRLPPPLSPSSLLLIPPDSTPTAADTDADDMVISSPLLVSCSAIPPAPSSPGIYTAASSTRGSPLLISTRPPSSPSLSLYPTSDPIMALVPPQRKHPRFVDVRDLKRIAAAAAADAAATASTVSEGAGRSASPPLPVADDEDEDHVEDTIEPSPAPSARTLRRRVKRGVAVGTEPSGGAGTGRGRRQNAPTPPPPPPQTVPALTAVTATKPRARRSSTAPSLSPVSVPLVVASPTPPPATEESPAKDTASSTVTARPASVAGKSTKRAKPRAPAAATASAAEADAPELAARPARKRARATAAAETTAATAPSPTAAADESDRHSEQSALPLEQPSLPQQQQPPPKKRARVAKPRQAAAASAKPPAATSDARATDNSPASSAPLEHPHRAADSSPFAFPSSPISNDLHTGMLELRHLEPSPPPPLTLHLRVPPRPTAADSVPLEPTTMPWTAVAGRGGGRGRFPISLPPAAIAAANDPSDNVSAPQPLLPSPPPRPARPPRYVAQAMSAYAPPSSVAAAGTVMRRRPSVDSIFATVVGDSGLVVDGPIVAGAARSMIVGPPAPVGYDEAAAAAAASATPVGSPPSLIMTNLPESLQGPTDADVLDADVDGSEAILMAGTCIGRLASPMRVTELERVRVASALAVSYRYFLLFLLLSLWWTQLTYGSFKIECAASPTK
ncbi:hypothetical protein BC828DRAFT_226017 [Blastocladiella britannica]|nr:hypothetical protein BC828DRAFT_226017 [Blastocladiella britannica]